MELNMQKDHFLIGYDEDNVVFIRYNNQWSYDYLPRLGYDVNQDVTASNNLTAQASKNKSELLHSVSNKFWKKPSITVVTSKVLSQAEVIHWYQFCKMVGGIETAVLNVSSVIHFMQTPHYKFIRTHYMLSGEHTAYGVMKEITTVVK
jgi:hypothetical protein